METLMTSGREAGMSEKRSREYMIQMELIESK